MKIRKNGKVIRLTESDLRRITKKVLRESEIFITPTKQDLKKMKRIERKNQRDDARMARKDAKNVNPEEITNFIKNGGSIFNKSNKNVTGDGKSGYKFQRVEDDGIVILGWSKGEGLALAIDPENKTFAVYERGGMSDRWSVTDEGSFMFDGKQIKLV